MYAILPMCCQGNTRTEDGCLATPHSQIPSPLPTGHRLLPLRPFSFEEKNNRPTIPDGGWPRAHTSDGHKCSRGLGREGGGGQWGCGEGGCRTHLAATDAHATVVELEFVQGEAGGALEQGLESSHAVGPKRVVTQVQLHQLSPGCDESLPK